MEEKIRNNSGYCQARIRILPFLLVFLIAAAPHVHAGRKDRPKRSSDLVWPLPPDPPRIRYVGTLHGSTDFAKKQSRFKRFLLGPETEHGLMFRKPYAVATDSSGRVYVSDTGLGAVLVFDEREREVSLFGAKGRTKLITPVGLAFDERGRLFVADADLDLVLCFDEREDVVLALGTQEGMRNPVGLAIDKHRRRLYVADSHLHQVLVYSTGGQFLGAWGSRGSEEGQFNFPTNVALGAEGNVYVVDTGNFRVQIFDPEGRLLSSFGQAGSVTGSFHRPKGIGVDSRGHIYVADAAFNNFQVFDREGQLLLHVGSAGRTAGTFWLPAGLHIDGEDRVFVVDQINKRVQIFQYVGD